MFIAPVLFDRLAIIPPVKVPLISFVLYEFVIFIILSEFSIFPTKPPAILLDIIFPLLYELVIFMPLIATPVIPPDIVKLLTFALLIVLINFVLFEIPTKPAFTEYSYTTLYFNSLKVIFEVVSELIVKVKLSLI